MRWFNASKVSFILFLLLGISCKDVSRSKEKTSRVEKLPYYSDASFTPKWFEQSPSKDFHKIPYFLLINQNGDTVTTATFKDKIYVTDFFFTSCPGICPKMTSNMLALQEEFKLNNDILLLSHSVTPEFDSVSILKHYAEAKGVISNKWHLVTGNRKQIYNLGRFSYFVEEDLGIPKGEDDFLHTESFILIDKNQHIRGIYNGLNKASVNQLIADIKVLQKNG